MVRILLEYLVNSMVRLMMQPYCFMDEGIRISCLKCDLALVYMQRGDIAVEVLGEASIDLYLLYQCRQRKLWMISGYLQLFSNLRMQLEGLAVKMADFLAYFNKVIYN